MSASDSDSLSSCGSQPVHDTVYPVGVETEVPGTEGGLKKTVLVEGTGTLPAHGSKVTVHYVGTLESDGSQFDSSRDRGEYFEFTIGRGEVIKGWDKGVATMRVGEKAMLRCTAEYAYGAAGSPPKIPPNATLLFEVELFDWSKEEDISPAKNKTIMKHTTAEGVDYEKPGYESTITLDLRVYQGTQEDGKLLAERSGWTLVIGDEPLPPFLETCLATMRKKEAAAFRIAASTVTASFEPFGIAAGEQLTYTVELHELQTVKTWEFTGQAKVDEGLRRKEEGNDALKRGELERAERKYRRSLEFVDSDYGMEDEAKTNCHTARVAVLGNLSQVLLQQQKFSEVMENCKRILELEPTNLKALFRRARAADSLQEWDAARADLEKLLEIDPNNADAKLLLRRVHDTQKEHLKKQQALYKKMFAA